MITICQFHGFSSTEIDGYKKQMGEMFAVDDSVKITAYDDVAGLLIIHFTKEEKK